MAFFSIQASDNFWLSLPTLGLIRGQIVGLHGASGSGKSQFLRALCDLDPNPLELELNDRPRNSIPASQWRRQLQYLPAEPVWWQNTAAEAISERWQKQVAAIGLSSNLLHRPISQLSTGERQRCALLRALSTEPTVLLLDEPTAALDSHNAEQVERLLQQWVREKSRAIIWVSHDPAQRKRVANQQWQISHNTLTVVSNNP